MKLQRTFAGLEIEARAHGWARWPVIAFLTVWLLFWAVGEVMVILVLVRASWGLVTGEPIQSGGQPATPVAVIGVGLFLGVWLALWSVGGWMASRALFRLVFGRERGVAQPDGLAWTHRWLFGREAHLLPRGTLRRFRVAARTGRLVADTTTGAPALSTYLSAAEAREVAAALNAEYGLDPSTPPADFVPPPWQELRTHHSERVLVLRSPGARIARGIGAGISALCGSAAIYLAPHVAGDPRAGWLATFLVAIAGVSAWLALTAPRRRLELVVAPGQLTLRRRTARAPLLVAARIALEEEKDSDGDVWYRLVAIAEVAPPATPRAHSARERREEIDRTPGDPGELSAFGRWLAAATHLPFDDRGASGTSAR